MDGVEIVLCDIHLPSAKWPIVLYHWLVKNNVKIHQVYICINTVNTIGLNFIKGILMACNLTDLKMLTIVGPRIVPKSDIEKKFIERNLAMGLPSSLMDDWYPIHHVIVENANDIEHLDVPITKETFHRPILTKFAHSLKRLSLGIFSVSYRANGSVSNNNQYEEITEAIENMPNLEHLSLKDVADEHSFHSKKSIMIRSESLQLIILNFILLEACTCPSLNVLCCGDESLINIEGDVRRFYNPSSGDCSFKAGVGAINMIGIHVPDNCKVVFPMDHNEELDSEDEGATYHFLSSSILSWQEE